MLSLANLPVKILLAVLNYILLENIESFAQTCHRVASVAQALSRHRRQFACKFSSCNIPFGIQSTVETLLGIRDE